MENRLWQKEYNLRASDFDKFDHVKPSAVLDLFQDAAGQHAETLGVGFESMLTRSYLWVLVRIKFQIVSQPKRYQKVIVKTWPLAPHRLNYRREYCIENQDGEKLVIGSSEWVVIHSEKRRLVAVPDLYPFTDNFYPEMNFEARLDRVPEFDSIQSPYMVCPGFCELDGNNHVNNTKYANYVLDALNPGASDEVQTFQIDFRKEVLQGDKLSILHINDDGMILAKGVNESGETMFACKLQYKETPEI